MTDRLCEAGLAPVAQRAAGYLLNSLWQGAIVAGVIAAALGVRGASGARVRYALAYAGLVVIVLAGLTPWARVDIRLPAGIATWIAVSWMIGVIVLSLRLLGGWHLLSQRRAEPTDATYASTVTRVCACWHITRRVTIVSSAHSVVPGLIGWRRPVIVLPQRTLATASGPDVEAILTHELAHVARGDYVANVLQTIVDTLFFFHPAVWWLSRRARIEREYCCDDLAATWDTDPLAYPDALIRLEQARLLDRPTDDGPSGGDMVMRVRRFTQPSRQGADTGMRAWSPIFLFSVATPIALWVVHTGLAWTPVPLFSELRPLWHTNPMMLVFGTALGLLLGARHACEPDHLLAISTLMTGEHTAAQTTALGLSWGLGHTCALLAVGAGLAMVHLQLPARVSDVFEFSVSLMLIALGGRAMVMAWRQGADGPNHVHAHGAQIHRHRGAVDHVHVGRWPLARRPLLVGMVHGLAGSGALTALVMANLPTVSAQLAYIVVFGVGSTIGMAALSACAGWPLARIVQRPLTVAMLSCVSGALSLGYGVFSGSPILWHWLCGPLS